MATAAGQSQTWACLNKQSEQDTVLAIKPAQLTNKPRISMVVRGSFSFLFGRPKKPQTL